MKTFHVLTVVLTFVILGCATPRMTEVTETMTLKQPPLVPAPSVRPEPPKPEELPPAKNGSKFSLSVRDADVRDIFLLLSKDSGVNIIADRNVTGKVSVDFTNLELNSALYAITRQLGYTYKMENGFIRISRAQMATRTFYVNYVKDVREAKSTTNITGFSGTQENRESPSMNVSLTTQSTSDFWTALEDALQIIIFGNVDKQNSLKSRSGFSRGDAEEKNLKEIKEKDKAKDSVVVDRKSEKDEVARNSGSEAETQKVSYSTFESKTERKLVVNELAGIVQVTDYVDNMPNIASFLEDIERAVRKQVMIQAHIVEVALNDGYKFGVDWEVITRSGTEMFSLSQGLSNVPASGVFQLNYKLNLWNKNVETLLDAVKEQGQVNVLSSPKISTMNNQRAVIKLTTKEVSWVNTRTYIGNPPSLPVDTTTPQVDEIGLFLDVTPQIDNDGVITLQIHPSISEKLAVSTSPDGKSTKPIINVREVDTMIKVTNGQTIVIAGLITDKINDATKRVPLLGDLPLIGSAFRQVAQEKRKSELVILLTPYVLTNQSIEDIRKEHEDRLRKAGRLFEGTPVLPFHGK